MDRSCTDCGTLLGEGRYCGECGAWNGEGEPPARPDRWCPVCGTVNRAENIYCENCAFRLDRVPLSQPRRAVFNARVFTYSVLLVIGLIFAAQIVRILGGDGEEASVIDVTSTTEPTADSSPRTGSTAVAAEQLVPSSASGSSSFSEALGPQNLIDDDPTTYWNDDSRRGAGAELILELAVAAAIERVVLQNVVDDTAFQRNYRIRGYEITTDDVASPLTGELADTQDPQTIQLATTATTRLTLRVTSTYPAESVDGQAPFEELAVAEVTVFGRLASG